MTPVASCVTVNTSSLAEIYTDVDAFVAYCYLYVCTCTGTVLVSDLGEHLYLVNQLSFGGTGKTGCVCIIVHEVPKIAHG